MRRFSWLRGQINGERPAPSPRPRRAGARPAPRSRPRLEALEDRCVPSTLSVTSTLDDVTQKGTLRYAVANAGDGDTILLTEAVRDTGITLTQGELVLTQQDLTIRSASADHPVAISGNNLSRILEVAGGANVTLSNVVITGGVALADNPAGDATQDGFGGGALVDAAASLTVSGCTVSDNSAYYHGGDPFNSYSGGGIYNGGTLTVTDSTISGNSTGGIYTEGGGLYNVGTATVTNSTFSGNSAQLAGGGICNFFGGTLTISGCTLTANTAFSGFAGGLTSAGGGIENLSTLTMSGCTVSGNYASAYGSGIADDAGSATISNSTISGNTDRPGSGSASVGYGGGIFNNSPDTLTVSDCTVSDNSASYEGGGIYNNFLMTISGGAVSGNSAPYGGGIYTSRPIMVTGCLLCGNSATYGGAIYNSQLFSLSAITVSGCTLSGNTAQYGGAIYTAFGKVTVSGSTLSGNTAFTAGGGIYIDSVPANRTDTVTVNNSSSITRNTAPVGADIDNLSVLYLDSTSIIGILDGNPAQPI
jgi:predicted outer membrane repeat protein